MTKIERCEKWVAFRKGDANLTCVLPKNHEGACATAEECRHCNGTGRTGKIVEVREVVPKVGARTVEQAMAKRAQEA